MAFDSIAQRIEDDRTATSHGNMRRSLEDRNTQFQ